MGLDDLHAIVLLLVPATAFVVTCCWWGPRRPIDPIAWVVLAVLGIGFALWPLPGPAPQAFLIACVSLLVVALTVSPVRCRRLVCFVLVLEAGVLWWTQGFLEDVARPRSHRLVADNQRRLSEQSSAAEVGKMLAAAQVSAFATGPAAWVADLATGADASRIRAAATRRSVRSAIRWHTCFTGFMRAEEITVHAWFPGGWLADAELLIEWRERAAE